MTVLRLLTPLLAMSLTVTAVQAVDFSTQIFQGDGVASRQKDFWKARLDLTKQGAEAARVKP